MVHQPHTATTSQTVQRCHRRSKPEPRRAIHKTMVVSRKYQRRIEWVKGWSGLGSSIVVWGGEVKQGIGYPLRCDFLLWSTEPASLGHYDVVRKVLSLKFWDIQKPGEKTSARKTLGDWSLLSEMSLKVWKILEHFQISPFLISFILGSCSLYRVIPWMI
jgi:hypothetical protein